MREPLVPQFDAETYFMWESRQRIASNSTMDSSSLSPAGLSTTIASR